MGIYSEKEKDVTSPCRERLCPGIYRLTNCCFAEGGPGTTGRGIRLMKQWKIPPIAATAASLALSLCVQLWKRGLYIHGTPSAKEKRHFHRVQKERPFFSFGRVKRSNSSSQRVNRVCVKRLLFFCGWQIGRILPWPGWRKRDEMFSGSSFDNFYSLWLRSL